MSSTSINVSYVIRYISERIGRYDKPESLTKWCEKAMQNFSPYSLNLTRCSVQNHLHRIEKLEGFSLMEKLQLVFIFSQPVRDGFVKLLKDAKFLIEQDDKKRIRSFSTEDGSIVRFSDHNRFDKYFKGVPCMNNPLQRKAITERIKLERELGQLDVENSSSDMKEEPKQIEVMQEEIESEVKEKQIHDISIGEEPKQEVDGYMTIGEDVGQEGYSGNIGRNASQETAKIQQGIDNDNPVSEKEGEATKMEPKRRESDLEFEKESIGDTSIQPLEPSSNFTATDAPQVETPEKTPAIPKVDKTVQTSSTSSNSCASEATPDAPQIETSEKTPATSSNSSFLLSNPEPNTSVISKIDKAVQTSSKSSDSSNEPNISVIALAGQIKTIAVFYKLESLQNNACLAMEKMKRVKEFGQEKKLSAKKFSILVHSMLISFEENRMRKTKSSICLESILKQLLQFLIRPLGTHIVHEAIELVAQKLREYENDDDGILPNVISENLNYLLMATGFYNQLE